MFSGSIVAIITPFDNQKIDYNAFKQLMSYQINNGTSAIVVAGSTGEGGMLSMQEREQLLITAIQISSGRIPIIAGCSASTTADSINLVKQAERLGCTAALVTPPCYIKPSQQGIIEHFDAILAETNIPVIVYNNPARVSVDISLSTFEALAQKEKIMGIKDSHPDISRVAQMKLILGKLKESQKMPKTKFFSLLCGDSPVFAAFLGMGGHGCISVTANILPHLSASLFKAWEEQDLKAFHAFRDQLMPMDMALQCESNPTPVKCAASLLGFCNNELKFPLKPVAKTNESSIQDLLKGYDFKLPFEELQKKSA